MQSCNHQDGIPIIVGSDFNVNPMCWVVGHRIDDRLEIFDEIVLTDANTPRTLNELWWRWGHHIGGWQFYGDASGRSRKTSATKSDYAHIWNDERFKKAGRTLHYAAANPDREDRFSATNARLCTAAGVRRVFVDPRCEKLIEDYETRSYKPGTREPADAIDQGHASDAADYIIWRIWPLRLKMPEKKMIATGEGLKPWSTTLDAAALGGAVQY